MTAECLSLTPLMQIALALLWVFHALVLCGLLYVLYKLTRSER